MEIHQLRHFIAVAESGGFTKGAQRAAVSQPAISASIAKLEAELDVKLLERRHSQVVPTAAGLRLLEVGKVILQTCNAVKAEVKSLASRKPFKLGILQLLFSGDVSRLLGAFRDLHRNLPLEVSDGTWEQLFASLEEQELDAALTILNGKESKFASRVLWTAPYVLAAPENHRFAARDMVALPDLSGEPFILPKHCPCLKELRDALASSGVKVRLVYETDRDDRALSLVAAGIGLALVPRHPAAPGVKQIPVSGLELSRSVGLVWPREREDLSLKEFISFAEGHCRAQ
ncbi:MAG TPA: LysR family transcriptional regulator [Methylocella sp.]|nr:LysR family transcriptional regulator [Methylocella sp.]